MSDYRDLVIEQLGDELLEAQEHAVAYRQLAIAALEKVHNQELENASLRRQLEHLRDELRREHDQHRCLREHVMRGAIQQEAA